MTNQQGRTPDHELGTIEGDKDFDHLSPQAERFYGQRGPTGPAGNSDLGEALRDAGLSDAAAPPRPSPAGRSERSGDTAASREAGQGENTG